MHASTLSLFVKKSESCLLFRSPADWIPRSEQSCFVYFEKVFWIETEIWIVLYGTRQIEQERFK